jgi:hypothetical protein
MKERRNDGQKTIERFGGTVEYMGEKISLTELAVRLELPITTVFRKYKEWNDVGKIITYAKNR